MSSPIALDDLTFVLTSVEFGTIIVYNIINKEY